MTAAVRIERVMEETDFPFVARPFQRVVYPQPLLVVEVVAVQHEEACVALRKGVVAFAAHVERLIETVARIVVVAECRVEANARVEQRPVRPFEFQHEVPRRLSAIDVVAEHQDHLEGKLFAGDDHLARDLVFVAIAGSVVANHGEPEGVGPDGRRLRHRRAQRTGRTDRDEDRNQDPHNGLTCRRQRPPGCGLASRSASPRRGARPPRSW